MKVNKNKDFVCIAKIVAKKDKLSDVLKVFSDLKKLSPMEDGCLRYELYQDQENPLIFTFVDRFKDAQAFESHCEQEYTTKYFDDILPDLVDSMEITTQNEIEIEG